MYTSTVNLLLCYTGGSRIWREETNDSGESLSGGYGTQLQEDLEF